MTNETSTAVVQTKPRQVVAEVPKSGDFNDWTARESALMQFAGLGSKIVTGSGQVIWQGAPRDVVEAFLVHVTRTGLDPTAKQIFCAEMGGKWTIGLYADGFRLVAERTGQYQGQTPKEWLYPDGEWRTYWAPEAHGLAKGAKPIAARVGVLRHGFAQPLVVTVTWGEFGKDTDRAKDNWNVRPSHMLGIRAETHALRAAFPMELSGLYTKEDFDQMIEGEVEDATDWATQIDALPNDKASAAALWQEINQAKDWTEKLKAEFAGKLSTMTHDSRPPKAGAPGHTGNPVADAPSASAAVAAPPLLVVEEDPNIEDADVVDEASGEVLTPAATPDPDEEEARYEEQAAREHEEWLSSQGAPAAKSAPRTKAGFNSAALGGA